MLLLLMDGDEPSTSQRNARLRQQQRLRNKSLYNKQSTTWAARLGYPDDDIVRTPLPEPLYKKRILQNYAILKSIKDNKHSRYYDLIQLNDGRDVENELKKIISVNLGHEIQRIKKKKEKNDTNNNNNNNTKHHQKGEEDVEDLWREILLDDKPKSSENVNRYKEMDDVVVWNYPRNATGYYRGMWVRGSSSSSSSNNMTEETLAVEYISVAEGSSSTTANDKKGKEEEEGTTTNHVNNEKKNVYHIPLIPALQHMDNHGYLVHQNVSIESISPWAQSQLHKRNLDVGIMFLPPSIFIEDASSEADKDEEATTTTTTKVDEKSSSSSSSSTTTKKQQTQTQQQLSLTKQSGRAAFQLYYRPIPAMNELSIVDGLIKLYDGMTTSFVSRRTDVLLRVRGVLIHGIGKISLVTYSTPSLTSSSSSSSSSNQNSVDGSSSMKRRSFLGIRQVVDVNDGTDDKKDEVDNVVVEDPQGGVGKEDSNHEDDQVEEEEEIDFSFDKRHRRLQSAIEDIRLLSSNSEKQREDHLESKDTIMGQIRQEVMDMYSSLYINDKNVLHDIMSNNEMQKAMKDGGWTLLQSVDDGDGIMPNVVAEEGENDDELSIEDVESSFSSSSQPTSAIQKHQMRELKVVPLEELDPHRFGVIDSQDVIFYPTHVDANVSPTTDDDAIMSSDSKYSSQQSEVSKDLNVTKDGSTSATTSDRRNVTTPLEMKRRSQAEIQEEYVSSGKVRYIFPYPYVTDDAEGSIQKTSSPATRKLPGREQALEANAANCEFEINVEIQPTKWTFGEWRSTMEQRLRVSSIFNPYDWNAFGADYPQYLLMKSQLDFLDEKQTPDEALVMTMVGNIESKNCDFHSFVNVTAMRTNWEHTTAKAINYSFYMMLTCLTQIVILLRQLLHTQSQSVASNVSLLCIGWQTVLDAILCISHIFLCLVMQPLFTAFASVAFFKLLIFCVIEMKYMAIIIQARNNANNTGLTQEDMRRQVTLLHLKFYGALMSAILAFWYFGQTNRTLYVLGLYSFWVPQIILNVVTESRKPMHPYYMYGMSATRLVAPLYVFAIRNNFLKEVNPDFPTEPQMCQLLVLWVGIQTAILYAQSKYGTRFMIPQR